MINSERLRTSVRLRIQKGQVLLRYSGVPTVVATLLDLSEGGCRCLLPLDSVDQEDARAWRRVLEEDRVLNIELHFPPFVNDFPLEAEVRVVEPVPGNKVELGLKFLNLHAEQQKVLGQIMLAVAVGKVREAFKAEKASQSGRYLVGARTQAAQPADQVFPLNSDQRKDMPTPSARASSADGRGAGDTKDPGEKADQTSWQSPFGGKRLGEVLVQMGLMAEKDVEEAVLRARGVGQRLGRFLLQTEMVKPDELCRALALQSGLPVADLTGVPTIAPLGGLFPHSLMAAHKFVPMEETKDAVCIAVANPLPLGVVGELGRVARKRVEVFLAREDHVLIALDRLQPVERNHERRFSRYPIVLPVTYQLCNRLGRLHEIRCYVGRTLNVSRGGLQIEGEVPGLGKPDQVHRRGLCLRVALTVEDREIELLCDPRFIRVREEVRPGEEFPWVFGLRVLEMSAQDRELYDAFCEKLEQKGPVIAAP